MPSITWVRKRSKTRPSITAAGLITLGIFATGAWYLVVPPHQAFFPLAPAAARDLAFNVMLESTMPENQKAYFKANAGSLFRQDYLERAITELDAKAGEFKRGGHRSEQTTKQAKHTIESVA